MAAHDVDAVGDAVHDALYRGINIPFNAIRDHARSDLLLEATRLLDRNAHLFMASQCLSMRTVITHEVHLDLDADMALLARLTATPRGVAADDLFLAEWMTVLSVVHRDPALYTEASLVLEQIDPLALVIDAGLLPKALYRVLFHYLSVEARRERMSDDDRAAFQAALTPIIVDAPSVTPTPGTGAHMWRVATQIDRVYRARMPNDDVDKYIERLHNAQRAWTPRAVDAVAPDHAVPVQVDAHV
jgi:hypothetical protein